jgi:hypothetical protein
MGELIPVFGMVTGVLVTGFLVIGLVRIMQSPVGIALARKIQGGRLEADEDIKAELADLREQLENVQHQLSETQERLDFTERVLTQHKQAQLPGEV